MTDLETYRVVAMEVLNAIVDPCSVRAGAAAGLVDMGLVTSCEVSRHEGGWRIMATIGVTDPTCLMAAVFLAEADQRLRSLPDVVAVECRLDHGPLWTPARLSAAYAGRLEQARAARRTG